uniref:Palmitoyltransferase n=1 Tax=Equus caballus TaxID=9796 RepID=A0A9L0R0G2_HORSE
MWCPKCCFLRSLRTYHVPWCNICVEEFDHHRKWVNNCIGHSNFRVFMLLVQSLCLYSDAMLVTCLILLVRTIHLPFTTDKIIVYQPGCGAPLGSARGQHPSGHTRRRLPAASLRAAANQGQVGERGPALPRGQAKSDQTKFRPTMRGQKYGVGVCRGCTDGTDIDARVSIRHMRQQPTGICEDDPTVKLNEPCRMHALQARMMEKLTESMVPDFLGRNISTVTTFMFNYSAFNTSRQVLDQLFTR